MSALRLLLIDPNYISQNTLLTNDLEKIKLTKRSLDVLALAPLLGGIISKENFSESLFDYLTVRGKKHTDNQAGSHEGVD